MNESERTILVVEDDPAVADLIRRALEREDYRVVVAATGEAARAAMGEVRPSAVILDVVLPGNDSGPLLGDFLQRHFRGVPVLYMSGYGRGSWVTAGMPPDAPWLQKPFTPEQVVAAVRALDPSVRGPDSH